MPTLKEALKNISAHAGQQGQVIIPEGGVGHCCWLWTKVPLQVDLSTDQSCINLLANIQTRRADLEKRRNSNTVAPIYTDIIIAFIVGGLAIVTTILESKSMSSETNSFSTAKLAISSIIAFFCPGLRIN